VIVQPLITAQRQRDSKVHDMTVVDIDLDANENMFGWPLHEVHAVDPFGRAFYWYETSHSLKELLDVAVDS
jgi:hypothetical protein